jgi:hypothetical protein
MKRIRKGYSRNESISPKIIKAEKHQNLNAKFRCSILTLNNKTRKSSYPLIYISKNMETHTN